MGLAPLRIVHMIYWFREPMTRAWLWSGTFCLRVYTQTDPMDRCVTHMMHVRCGASRLPWLFFVLLSFLWGLVATALTIGWGNIESSPLVEPSLIEIPQVVAVG